MAGSINRAILIGRVGKDPELARLQSGKPVAKFSLATSETWKDQTGERKERTTWHNIVCYSEGLCSVIEKYIRKGSNLYIEGSISNRSYEKDGQTRYISEVVLQGYQTTLLMLDSKRNDNQDSSPDQSYGDITQGDKAYSGGGDMDSEIPFAAEWRA